MTKRFALTPVQNDPSRVEAGVDNGEVGRGCLAGPVVAAAVILPTRPADPRTTRFEAIVCTASRDTG